MVSDNCIRQHRWRTCHHCCWTQHCGEAVWLQVQTGGHTHSRAAGGSFHTVFIQDLPPLFGTPSGLPPGAASPSHLCFHEAAPEVLGFSQCWASYSMGGACGGSERASMIGAVPGQWPMDRGELTPPTDPEGSQRSLRSTLHFTDGDTEFQRELGRKCRRQRFVLIPFIVLHPLHSPDLVFRQSWAGLGSWSWATGREPRIRPRFPPDQR